MKKDALTNVPAFYQNYIDQVADVTLKEALHRSLDALNGQLQEKLLAIGDTIYAPEKWTIKDILQHLIDAERVMSYRAMRFARQDATELPGFDQDTYVPTAKAARRSVPDLMEELKAVRISSIFLFESMTDEMLQQSGRANNNLMSVPALGFIIAGHQQHHLNIIEERYLPLVKAAAV